MGDLAAAVDIGTTALKVGVVTAAGEVVSTAEAECRPEYGADGTVRQDPEAWWDAFVRAFDQCLECVDRGRLRALAVSSQAQTFVWLDRRGRTLGKAVSWLEAADDPKPFVDLARSGAFYEHTGWPEPNPLLAVCKLAGRSRQQGAAGLVFADGWLLNRLAGRCCVNRNLAAMSGLYSMVLDDWWQAALDRTGLSREMLPELVETGAAVGVLRAEFARRFGIPQIPAAAGANDQTAAALGAGLAAAGESVLGLGTALVTYRVVEQCERRTDAACRPLRGPYPGGLRYELLVCSNAGPLLEWARRLAPGCRDWPEFFRTALSAPPGARGLRCHPEPGGRTAAVLDGITAAQGPGEVGRAVLEGLACIVRRQFECLEVESGEVRVCGGGARSPDWVQLIADVTGRDLRRLEQAHAGLLGTALCALCGAGLEPDVRTAVRKIAGRAAGTVHRPAEDARRKIYDAVYADVLALEERASAVR